MKLSHYYNEEAGRQLNIAINAKEYTYKVRVQARDKYRELMREYDKIMDYFKELAKEEAR